jgi:hypothetical protein
VTLFTRNWQSAGGNQIKKLYQETFSSLANETILTMLEFSRRTDCTFQEMPVPDQTQCTRVASSR